LSKIALTSEIKLTVKLAMCAAPFVAAAVALVILALLCQDSDDRLRLLGLAVAPSAVALYLYERLCGRAKLRALAQQVEEYEIDRDVRAAMDHYRQMKQAQGAEVLSIVHLLPPRQPQDDLKIERN
jgi:hypothetical protein